MSIAAAAERLAAGELLIHPTESVYGIGGFLEDHPLGTLRRMKARASGGFVVLIPSCRAVDPLFADPALPGRWARAARRLAEAFWPGPLTLVMDDPKDVFHPAAKAADGTVAVRVPGHPLTLELLAACGRPITSSSANRPGDAPARTARQAVAAAASLGLDCRALDAGPLTGGVTSTLLRLGPSGPVLIREGRVGVLDLSEVLGAPARHALRHPV